MFWLCLGLCEIEQTERGWYVTLIDKDPDSVKREMDSEKKQKMDLDDEQRRQKLIAEQVSFCSREVKMFLYWLWFRSKEIKKEEFSNRNQSIVILFEKMKMKKVISYWTNSYTLVSFYSPSNVQSNGCCGKEKDSPVRSLPVSCLVLNNFRLDHRFWLRQLKNGKLPQMKLRTMPRWKNKRLKRIKNRPQRSLYSRNHYQSLRQSRKSPHWKNCAR